MNLKEMRNRLNHNPLGKTVKKKGVALIMAMSILLFMVYVAKEVSRDSLIEYVVNSQDLNRLKAYYAAKNGMDMALLRVKIFQQVSRLPLPPGLAGQLDQIWKFPFAWPIPVDKDTNAVARDSIKKLNAESFMDASYTHTIDDEGTKIDINDLNSPSKTLRELSKKQIMTIFERKLEFDEEFRKNYQSFRFDELVNRMVDWMSDSNTSAGGSGGKKQYFRELGESYPPNRGFRTLDEMRLIPGMTEEFFNLLASQVTIYGMKAINPNTASDAVLKSLDKGMTDEAVKDAIERRKDPNLGGPFKGATGADCLKDFKDFVSSRGARLDPSFDQIPMVCDKVINFRISSMGTFGSGAGAVMKEITAVVIDLGRSASQIKTFVDKETPAPGNPADPTKPPPPGPTSAAPKQDPLPKGPPRVVYWSEN